MTATLSRVRRGAAGAGSSSPPDSLSPSVTLCWSVLPKPEDGAEGVEGTAQEVGHGRICGQEEAGDSACDACLFGALCSGGRPGALGSQCLAANHSIHIYSINILSVGPQQ